MRTHSLRGWLRLRLANVFPVGKRDAGSGAPVVQVDAELADLIPQYMSKRWADLHFARQLLAKGDFNLLSRMALRIRGSAASYGFTGLGVIAEALATAAEHQDAAAVAAQLGAFDAFLRAVRIEYL